MKFFDVNNVSNIELIRICDLCVIEGNLPKLKGYKFISFCKRFFISLLHKIFLHSIFVLVLDRPTERFWIALISYHANYDIKHGFFFCLKCYNVCLIFYVGFKLIFCNLNNNQIYFYCIFYSLRRCFFLLLPKL